MSTPRLDKARAILAEIATDLTEAGLADVATTLRLSQVAAGAANGIIVVAPPSIDFTTFTTTASHFELMIFAGPSQDLERAWARVDAIIEALRVAQWPILTGEPCEFKPPQGVPIQGYTLTLDTLEN